MSIGTVGLIDHKVSDPQNESDVLARLLPTVPVLMRASDYLSSVLPTFNGSKGWRAVHDYTYFAYWGPASFSVQIGPQVAVIDGGCRHSAFVTIRPLQEVLLPAFRSIAQALGATRLALTSDQDDRIQYDAALSNGASLDECLAMVRQNWGEPHPRMETFSEEVGRSDKLPIWYVELIPTSS